MSEAAGVRRILYILAAHSVLPPSDVLPSNDEVFQALLSDLSRGQASTHARMVREVAAEVGVPAEEIARRAEFLLACLVLPASGNHYEVLGVSPKASSEEIRKRWAVLIHRYHPDHFGGKGGWIDNQARRLIDAYQTLKDPALRRSYDAQLTAPQREIAPPPRVPRGPSFLQRVPLRWAPVGIVAVGVLVVAWLAARPMPAPLQRAALPPTTTPSDRPDKAATVKKEEARNDRHQPESRPAPAPEAVKPPPPTQPVAPASPPPPKPPAAARPEAALSAAKPSSVQTSTRIEPSPQSSVVAPSTPAPARAETRAAAPKALTPEPGTSDAKLSGVLASPSAGPSPGSSPLPPSPSTPAPVRPETKAVAPKESGPEPHLAAAKPSGAQASTRVEPSLQSSPPAVAMPGPKMPKVVTSEPPSPAPPPQPVQAASQAPLAVKPTAPPPHPVPALPKVTASDPVSSERGAPPPQAVPPAAISPKSTPPASVAAAAPPRAEAPAPPKAAAPDPGPQLSASVPPIPVPVAPSPRPTPPATVTTVTHPAPAAAPAGPGPASPDPVPAPRSPSPPSASPSGAGSQLTAVRPPSPVPGHGQADPQRELLAIVEAFRSAYERKDLPALMGLFGASPREKDAAGRAAVQQLYARNFARLGAVRYELSQLEVAPRQTDGVVHVQGRFRIRATLLGPPWNPLDRAGQVRLTLRREAGALRIVAVDYDLTSP